MIFVLMILVIFGLTFITFINGSIIENHARIGNFTQNIPGYSLCGFSRKSLQTRSKCFKYHQNVPAPLLNARKAMPGEAPWVVRILFHKDRVIKGRCTGSLITPEWVVTAGHCYKEGTKATVYFGTEQLNPLKVIHSKKIIVHPDYNGSRKNDIGLIQLKSPYKIKNLDESGEYYDVNTLCLPPNNITLRKISRWGYRPEFVFISGWGTGNDNHLRITGLIFNRLEDLYGYDFKVYKTKTIKGVPICKGDSGSPVWQYYIGRAILIGVTGGYDYWEDKPTGCGSVSYGAYVPKFVDWIISEIKTLFL